MKNLNDILLYTNFILAGLVIIFSSCLTTVHIRLKEARVRIALFEISKLLRDNRSFTLICKKYQKLPLKKFLLVENYELDNYVKAQLKYFLSSNELHSQINHSRMDAKRKKSLLITIIKSIIRTTPTEKLAEIYIECLFRDILGDDTTQERDFIITSIVYSGNEKLAFRDAVLQKIEAPIGQMQSADQITLIRAEIIKFKKLF